MRLTLQSLSKKACHHGYQELSLNLSKIDNMIRAQRNFKISEAFLRDSAEIERMTIDDHSRSQTYVHNT